MTFRLRHATSSDAAAIADVFSASLRLLAFLPRLHTAEDERRFITNVILRECAVTVAEDDSAIVAFLALHGDEVRLLYVRPDRIGLGAGGLLIDDAKLRAGAVLELWCFQGNSRARAFYEARGFQAIRLTDGSRNEERTPDILYRWRRPQP
jgi:GNAT superfamily N-acetyltransferase